MPSGELTAGEALQWANRFLQLKSEGTRVILIKQLTKRAIEGEREECAKIVVNASIEANERFATRVDVALWIGKAIRSRSDA